jgi:hypothetical protein
MINQYNFILLLRIGKQIINKFNILISFNLLIKAFIFEDFTIDSILHTFIFHVLNELVSHPDIASKTSLSLLLFYHFLTEEIHSLIIKKKVDCY